ncbi:hypothetical protein SPFM17_00026 [Salmonella phage SPFM17]|nr:hypothetical protein SPFM4_00014 [Salmonella phage SPFM4]VFR12541.1 hypothetical protein SPFM11_00137 [Salmonella phage SPFM11]VFR13025.1 hypothetical protein SPFM13_00242 [Salmonella phage SPFM13]VFR13938.1 hypothetical protein SPFM17_00026 [Salmonella phage SPFM17]VFR14188.1 hypothetical protein SPFM16_00026 [Salmonella phage SPFM16]VFR14798.1 hypothetical protein SPFM19_00224 [Salmonella phage SPFM19]VFR15209.1 hypothetical protein SPFM22_00235 [Salmonella phage SPFM22]VFR15375.1 hypot
MQHPILAYIEGLVARYRYRPLPKKVREEALSVYQQHLNGFDKVRAATIGGVSVCLRWNRVVVGDYGAYLEIDEKDLLVGLDVPPEQAWRLDEEYIAGRKLSIKYHWLTFRGVKVYHQVDTVKYADYRPGKYYISVLEFDRS